MKKISYIILFLLLCLFTVNADADTHTVCSSGCDYTQATFEALSGTGYAGDTFYFSGTFSSTLDVGISGTSGNPVVLDGYETDDTTYMNLSEASGRAKIDVTTSDRGIDIDGEDYITVQDFEITDCSTGIRIGASAVSNDITIKRTYVYECMSAVGSTTTASYNIIIGGSSGHGNVFKNIGQTTADEDIALANSTHDVIISYNHLYADSASWGIDGIMCNGPVYDVLIEYNSIHSHKESVLMGDGGENGIDIKKEAYNWVVRFNHIYDHPGTEFIFNGDSIGACDEIYVYGNRIHSGSGTNAGLIGWDNVGKSYDNIYIFSNLFFDQDEVGLVIIEDSTLTYIFNNTFSEIGGSADDTDDGAMRIRDAPVLTFKNNIIIKSSTSTYSYRALYLDSASDTATTSDYNRYYWPSQTINIDWGDAGLEPLADIKTDVDNGLPQEANGSEADPGLTDWDNGDFTIASSESAVVDGGVDMGSGNIVSLTIAGVTVDVPWDFALGPNTDWSGNIPVIHELSRDTIGWDQGAYGWVEGAGEVTGAINFNSSGTGKFNYNLSGSGKVTR
jgi:hypothetical protein